ncbi:hypothetical protein [Pseudochelatococcus contaminans]|uniref:Uncharacterized protein n=1 Tax=Pseudochelatococcus contaminans TaxID=1538103 RepID=A0A7W5Z340_9HYPH|nr:hypothetical protein [Pseudochelatococcus contaminans]MBB3809230.1 hypothetical protein [Pseudochelatococcus contaminans]
MSMSDVAASSAHIKAGAGRRFAETICCAGATGGIAIRRAGSWNGFMRFLLRLAGFLFIAAGFVTFVVDGVRAIADDRLAFTQLGPVLAWLMPSFYPRIEPLAVETISPYLWDPVLVNVFEAPAFAAALVLGAILLWLGQRPAEPIGFSTLR